MSKLKNIQNKVQKVSILGCGWLGLPLAEHFVKLYNWVNGSTTTEDKLKILQSKGIHPFLINLKELEVRGEIEKFLNDSEILILNIPSGLRSGDGENYISKLKLLLRYLEKSTIKKVVFISSSSVYKEDESFVTVFENPESLAETEKATILIEAENIFLRNRNLETSVIRFSGLIGEDRHPAKYLSGKTEIENPDAPINLIHLNDCISVISAVIESDSWGEIYNASYPSHPSRELYYITACAKLGLEPPTFDHYKKNVGKKVSAQKIQEALNFRFTSPID
ncbi:Nucleoside-diphosphate-sugar epimerase [Flavobacteriaceae bacterium MAR_2010_188]|nr:Nucleoside-diphosphate-sugar epimerase [Flavobacteriaceae bacterium MAR_2010_188]